MSTNYYITHRFAIESQIPYEWVQEVHIAQYTAGGFLLQAIRANGSFTEEPIPFLLETAGNIQSPFYYSPVQELDTVENWKQMKSLIANPDFVVVSEYGVRVDAKDFIENVETQENGTDNRYRRMTDWLNNPENIWKKRTLRTDYIDKDGFSFETREFS